MPESHNSKHPLTNLQRVKEVLYSKGMGSGGEEYMNM